MGILRKIGMSNTHSTIEFIYQLAKARLHARTNLLHFRTSLYAA